MKIHFTAAHHKIAQDALTVLTTRYGQSLLKEASVVVALGGDGHILKTLYDVLHLKIPIFAMRRTESVGFLCNNYNIEDLLERIESSQKVDLRPLFIEAHLADGTKKDALAINEVSIIRETSQSARLRISVDGIERIAQYSGDGILVATPTGSTAYNHSCGGPIMPLDANSLVMTAICGYRPRGWKYAILPQDSYIDIDMLDTDKRPVRVEAGETVIRHASSLKIWRDHKVLLPLLFDPHEHLGERIIREQFML